jgi:parallel beta-helix repeat protein
MMVASGSDPVYAHAASMGTHLSVQAADDVPPEVGLPDLPEMPGRVEGVGTHFQLNSSAYLNVMVDSSEPIHLILESVPEMVTMHIEPITTATSAAITLGGFAPSTTYHKYEDDYHNHEAYTTDTSGRYAYTQDLSQAHLIFIQPRESTKYIKDDATGGDCAKTPSPIGTWKAATKTCTLNVDLTETIQIDSNTVTLDGDGHTTTGSNTGNGVYLPSGRTGVTIKNLKVKQFTYGINLDRCNSNTLTNNLVDSNTHGIYLYSSSSNTLSGNMASNNKGYGVYLYYRSSGNILTSNTVTGNRNGIILTFYVGGSILTGNTISGSSQWNFEISGGQDSDYASTSIDTSNTVDGKPIYYVKDAIGKIYDGSTNAGTFYCINCRNVKIEGLTLTKNGVGIFLRKTLDSTIQNNIASSNSYGIYLSNSDNNLLTKNTVNSNWHFGIILGYSNGNSLVNNTARSNINHGIMEWTPVFENVF